MEADSLLSGRALHVQLVLEENCTPVHVTWLLCLCDWEQRLRPITLDTLDGGQDDLSTLILILEDVIKARECPTGLWRIII